MRANGRANNNWNCRGILLLLLLPSIQLISQNLVPNPGFEEKAECQVSIIEAPDYVAWERVERSSTPDYYHAECKGFSVPENPAGYMPAYDGQAYAGVVGYTESKYYREFIRVELTEPLEAKREYRVRLRYALAPVSKYAVSDLGFALLKEPNLFDYFAGSFYGKKYKEEEKDFQTERKWTEINQLYVAGGGEKYLIIGNMDRDLHFSAKAVEPTKEAKQAFAYYYIDGVSVQPSEYLVETSLDKAFERKAKVNLGKIYFNSNDSELLEESGTQLESLLMLMQRNADAQLLVIGHTDNSGSDARNVELSRERAKSVVDFLKDKGVSAERLDFEGRGSLEPVATNNNPAGRQLNRRVEVLVR